MTESAPNQEGTWTDLLTPRRIIGGVIAIVALVAIFQNSESGDFNFLFFEFTAPKWLWLLAVFAAGFGTGWLVKGHRSAPAA